MKLIKLFFIGLLISLATVTNAQSNLKFGHINTQEVISAMPEFKSVTDELQAQYSQLEKQLTDMQEALQNLQKDYVQKMQSKALTQEEQSSMETQIQEGNEKVQRFYAQSQQSLQKKEQELKAPIFDKVTNAIQQVGQEGGFLYIFEESAGVAVYKSEKSVDVSSLVKAKLGIQ